MKLNPQQFQRIDGQLKAAQLPADEATQNARDTLHRMAADLTSKSGSIKSGYLKLVQAEGGALRMGTRWSTGADGSTRDALSYVRDLVDKGYGGDPKIQAAIENYVQGQGERLGTHSFVKLVRALEDAGDVMRPQNDRVSLAHIKANARLQTQGFNEAMAPQGQEEFPRPGASLHLNEVLVQEGMLAKLEEQEQPAPDLQEPVLDLPDVAVAEPMPQPLAAQGPDLAPLELARPAPPAPLAAPAPAVPLDRRAAALAALQLGQRAQAVDHLQHIEGALAPAQLAKLLVQDHLQGRAISTQMVLLAEAAYANQPAAQLDDVAQFIFAGATLPHGDRWNEAQFDASHGLSGLFDVAMLWQARRPTEAATLAHKLADLLVQNLPDNASASALAQQLRLVDASQTISLQQVNSDRQAFIALNLERLKLDDLDHPDQADAARDRILDLLAEIRGRHPSLKALGKKIETLREKVLTHQGKATIADRLKSILTTDFDRGEQSLRARLTGHASAKGYVSVNDAYDGVANLEPAVEQWDTLDRTVHKLKRPLQGSHFENFIVPTAQNSNFKSASGALLARLDESIDLRRCIFSGNAQQADFSDAILSGSDFTFNIEATEGAQLRRVDFSGADLEDARIHVNYKDLDQRLRGIRTGRNAQRSQEEVEQTLTRLMDHTRRSAGGSVLTMISSIDDRYAELKVGLMRQAMELLEREHCIDALTPALRDVLGRSPVFLADARIRELSSPVLSTMVDSLSQSALSAIAPFLTRPLLELTSNADLQAAQKALRDRIGLVNAVLRGVEDNPVAYDMATQSAAAQLRDRLNDLPEIKPLLPTLADLYMTYERADGVEVDMPYYFDLGRDGAVVALDADQYTAVSRADAAVKLVENSLFFVPPSQRYGEVNNDYYEVAGSPLVLLAAGNIKGRGVELLKQFPLLEGAYQVGHSTPANAILGQILEGPANTTTRQMFSDAFKGVARRLNAQEISDLEGRFAEVMPTLFTNVQEAGSSIHRWPELQLSEKFLQSLRDQAKSMDIEIDRPADFAHYLLTQSAALTRMSSEKVFGDGDFSIPSLRMLGYALYKQALQVEPELINLEESQDLQNRFLNQNGAFDCAEILSGMQLKISKNLNPAAFARLTPAVFKSAAG